MTVRQSLRAISADVLGALRTRVELFGAEWSQATAQLTALAGLLLTTVALLWLAVMMFSVLVVALTWSSPYRILAIVVLMLIYLLAGLVCLWLLKKRLDQSADQPFAATVQELGEDARMLAGAVQANRSGPDEQRRQGDGPS